MGNLLLETNKLNKSFGSVRAVCDFTVKLEAGKIYGLLGRNGAGKTTFLNLITSRAFATSGEIKINGNDAVENQSILDKICYMPEKNLFIPGMRVSEIIKSAAMFYENFDMEYADHLCNKFNLNKKKKYKALSRGYESILRVVIGLAARASLTVFDEPVLGLDAAVRDLFYRELIEDFTKFPRTFIVSTHLIEESADVFEEVLIIKEGELVIKNTVEDLKEYAHYISGKPELVDKAVAGLKILHSEMIGNVKVCAICGKLSDNGLSKLSDFEVDISPIPVQKLFIYLTNEKCPA